jgi:site-specific DNA-methyltransferase (adenine-specific)
MLEQNQIYQGDCLELMKSIKDKTIDMILCDLPYGITDNTWDSVIPFDRLWAEYNRIAKDNAAIVLTSQFPFTIDLINSNRKSFRYDLIWNKINTSGFLNANRMPLRSHEHILIFYKKLPVYNPQFTKGNPCHSSLAKNSAINSRTYRKFNKLDTIITDNKHPKSVITISKLNSPNIIHPSQKPVELFEYLIRTYTNEGDSILDNCIGSGTTAIAAINTNRNYIGIEKDAKYFDLAKTRIEDHKRLLDLFKKVS